MLKGNLGHNRTLIVEYGSDEMLPKELQDLLAEKYDRTFMEYYNDMRNNPKTWGMYACMHACIVVCIYPSIYACIYVCVYVYSIHIFTH